MLPNLHGLGSPHPILGAHTHTHAHWSLLLLFFPSHIPAGFPLSDSLLPTYTLFLIALFPKKNILGHYTYKGANRGTVQIPQSGDVPKDYIFTNKIINF